MKLENFLTGLKKFPGSFGRLSGFKKIQVVGVFMVALSTIYGAIWSIATILKLGHGNPTRALARRNQPAPEKTEAPREPAEETEKKAEPTSLSNYVLRDVTLSFTDDHTGRVGYAEFSLSLDLPTPEAEQWISLNRAKLLDSLHETAFNFQLQDFDSPDGIEKFKQSIKENWVTRFGATAPVEVNIQDWTLN
jgi:flagellar basal body-associated protein FliL